MRFRSLIAGICICLPLTILLSQPAQLIFEGVPYNIYPQTEESMPRLPSPYVDASGETFVVAVTKDSQFAIMPVTLHDTGWWKQLTVDTLDFPALGHTGLHLMTELYQTQTIYLTAKQAGSKGLAVMRSRAETIAALFPAHRLSSPYPLYPSSLYGFN